MDRPDFSLNVKIAVITGASRGIGEALATALAKNGVGVALLGRDAQALAVLHNVLTDSGGAVMYVVVDVTDTSALDIIYVDGGYLASI